LTQYRNGGKIYQYFTFEGLPKFTQIGIFGLKIYHLATLSAASILMLCFVPKQSGRTALLLIGASIFIVFKLSTKTRGRHVVVSCQIDVR
jgi:hypothetical protein